MADKKRNIAIWRENSCGTENANFHQPICFRRQPAEFFFVKKKIVKWKQVSIRSTRPIQLRYYNTLQTFVLTFSSRLNVDFFDIRRQKLNSWSSIEGVKFVGTFWTQYFTGFWKYKYISLGCTKSLSFYTAGSWEKRQNFGASQANIQLFLFCQCFRKKLALFMYGIGCYLFWYRSVSNDRISDPWPFQWLSRNLVLRRPGQMNILILAIDEILMFGSIYSWIFHSTSIKEKH